MAKLICAIILLCISMSECFYVAPRIAKFPAAVGSKARKVNDIRGRVSSPLTTEMAVSIDDIEGFSEAFVGGTVGVMSVAFLVELRKLNNKNLEGCPYCMGNGEILCGCCLGTGMVSGNNCEVCGGRGLVMCINCKGDGRETPILLISKAARNPEYATDSIDIDSP